MNDTHADIPQPGPLRIWLMASRPRTLGAAIAPVVIGAAMAYDAGAFHRVSALCALAAALLVQIGTNFANDYLDFVKGTDTDKRTGPTRVTQAGLVTPKTMRRATTLVFALIALPAAYAIYRGGWPFLAIAVASVACGVWYTAGPYPLGYIGLSDVAVLIFFGPVAVGGTYYLQALELPAQVIIAGIAPGLLAVALLTVNNLRDIEEDRAAGKKTLAVRFGAEFAKMEYLFCIVVSCMAVPLYFYGYTGSRWFALVALLGLWWGAPAARILIDPATPEAFHHALARTGMALLFYSGAFALAYIL